MASRTSLEVGPPADLQAPADIPVLSERLAEAIDRGAHHLLSLQTREGYWLGELEADTTLESDYIFYLHILGKADRTRVAKLANYIRRRQLSDGGWNIYFGGPSELNATVKAYLALKLAGDQPDAGCMERARRRVHELGGGWKRRIPMCASIWRWPAACRGTWSQPFRPKSCCCRTGFL